MRGWLLTIMTCLLLAPLPALAQQRHALVVGIDSYAHVAALEKARNDARDVAAALEAAGFRTDLLIDADETALLTALTVFAGRLDPGDEAVFYFAGHGVEIDGRNYLLPADVPDVLPGQELIVMRRALPVDDVIEAFQRRGARLSLLILDACRDNPFEQVAGRSLGRTRGLGRTQAPEGSFIMYSAGAGQAALDALSDDDPDRNSVFTRALLPRLTEPGLDLRAMVGLVRAEVRQLARTVGHNQFPAVYDQLDGEFQFIPAAVTQQPPPGPVTDPCAAAATVWATVEAADSLAALESFIEFYGEICPVFTALAEERMAALSGEAPNETAEAPRLETETETDPIPTVHTSADERRECSVVWLPQESQATRGGRPVNVRRGDILLFTTFRGGREQGEVSFTGGYPFGPDPVELTIGSNEFRLPVDGQWAWAETPEEDARIMAALRTGAQAVLRGRSIRGTETRDTFSLVGSNAAINEALRRCAD